MLTAKHHSSVGSRGRMKAEGLHASVDRALQNLQEAHKARDLVSLLDTTTPPQLLNFQPLIFDILGLAKCLLLSLKQTCYYSCWQLASFGVLDSDGDHHINSDRWDTPSFPTRSIVRWPFDASFLGSLRRFILVAIVSFHSLTTTFLDFSLIRQTPVPQYALIRA